MTVVEEYIPYNRLPSTFKAGDKVRCIRFDDCHYLKKDVIYTVIKTYKDHWGNYVLLEGMFSSWSDYHFELVKTKPLPYKWGVGRTYNDMVGRSYSIKYIEPTCMWVMWVGEPSHLYKFNLDGERDTGGVRLVPPTCHCCGQTIKECAEGGL